ncbi:MAG: hypothetical protein FWD99_06515 [Oscillospiraceae bacterium]|nr:hypothetical protein [Oscillospiraceae bacterium]
MKKLLTGMVAVLLLFALVGVALAGCGMGRDNDPMPGEAATLAPPDVPEAEVPVAEEGSMETDSMGTDKCENPIESTENEGITSANVRLYFADDERTQQWIPTYELFDLSQVEHYHEFIYCEDDMRIIFTTEATVHHFRFLSIVWNDNFFSEDADESERLYSVRSILYSLDELSPGIPFVVTGANMGSSAIATNGFSFVDKNGTTRYFAFHMSGYEGDDHPINIKEF